MPTTASFIVKLLKPHFEATNNKQKAALRKSGPDMCPYCEVYNDCATQTQTLTIMGAPSTFSKSPRTIYKPELTVELPCGCKMHYDCVLHELRAHEAYIFAEEHPHFACPKCRCEYSQAEQQAMEGNLSLSMPPDYICLIWDSNEGVHRRLAQINHTEDGPMLGRARTEGWWAKDTRPPKIYMNAIHPSYVEWGNSGFRTKNSNKFWDLWPRGPVRFTGLHADELTGAEVSNGADPAVWSWPNAGSDAPESCQQCEEASALMELLNRSKTDGHRHFAIYHCTTCDLVILDKPGSHPVHYPPPTCDGAPGSNEPHRAHKTAFNYHTYALTRSRIPNGLHHRGRKPIRKHTRTRRTMH